MSESKTVRMVLPRASDEIPSPRHLQLIERDVHRALEARLDLEAHVASESRSDVRDREEDDRVLLDLEVDDDERSRLLLSKSPRLANLTPRHNRSDREDRDLRYVGPVGAGGHRSSQFRCHPRPARAPREPRFRSRAKPTEGFEPSTPALRVSSEGGNGGV
jgi:hypothetical protein